MNEYFDKLNTSLFSLLNSGEILKTGMWGENSQFIRINGAKVRQTGIVNDLSYSLTLISNKRQTSYSLTITGILETDKNKLITILNKLRKDITQIPEDPFIVYPKSDESSEEKFEGNLLSPDDAIDVLMPPIQGVDLTGLWASGIIYTGVANSKGQKHWVETESFSLDYSLITKDKKMVKDCFAGTHWNQKNYEAYISSSKKQLDFSIKDLAYTDDGILINSDFVLKVLVSRSMHFWKGIFFEPGMQPFINPGLGSSAFPLKRSRLLASTKINELFLIFSSICFLFLIQLLFSLVW